MKPGAAKDLRNAIRQLRGARTSLGMVRVGLDGRADKAALEALKNLWDVLGALEELKTLDTIGRMEVRK